MNNNNDDEIDLLQLAKVLWHKMWAIVLTAVLVGGIFFSYAKFCITPLYQAKALMYVNNSSISVGSTSFSLSELSAAQTLVDTYIVILKTRKCMDAVVADAGVDYSYEEIVKMVDAEAVNGTEIFSVKVTDADPEEAQKIANSIAKVLPSKISEVVEGSDVRVVDHAVVPASKMSPSLTKYAAIGLMLGAVLSSMIIVIISLLDTKIHDEEYVINTYNLPVLASIPNFNDPGSKGSSYGYGYELEQSNELTE